VPATAEKLRARRPLAEVATLSKLLIDLRTKCKVRGCMTPYLRSLIRDDESTRVYNETACAVLAENPETRERFRVWIILR